MTESQSRYGIMEEINEQKLIAKEELASMQKDKVMKEINNNEQIQKLQDQITIIEGSFERVHANRVAKKNMEIQLLKQEMNEKIRLSEEEINEWNETYEENAKAQIFNLNSQLDAVKRQHDKYVKLKDMEITAKEQKIEELDKAISSLKEISKSDKPD